MSHIARDLLIDNALLRVRRSQESIEALNRQLAVSQRIIAETQVFLDKMMARIEGATRFV